MRETIQLTYRCEDEGTGTVETVPLSIVTLDDQGHAADIRTFEAGHTSMRHRDKSELIDLATDITRRYLYGDDMEEDR